MVAGWGGNQSCVCSLRIPKGVWGYRQLCATTQGPSWGYFKSQFLTGLSTFGDSSPQNGSKTVPKSQNRPLGYPTKGLSCLRRMARRRKRSNDFQTEHWCVSVDRGFPREVRNFISHKAGAEFISHNVLIEGFLECQLSHTIVNLEPSKKSSNKKLTILRGS